MPSLPDIVTTKPARRFLRIFLVKYPTWVWGRERPHSKAGLRAGWWDPGSLRALRREWLAGPVTNMQHRDHAAALVNRVNNPVDVPPAAVQQMAESAVPRRSEERPAG